MRMTGIYGHGKITEKNEVRCFTKTTEGLKKTGRKMANEYCKEGWRVTERWRGRKKRKYVENSKKKKKKSCR